ncbi:MAG: hypothetical protein N2Z74_09960, partial [Syntrophales bacterium]|nr:hypothetical protein [Syntrophales bacterium]
MGIKTGEQYRESLRKLKPCVYILGEKVQDVVASPHFRIPLGEMAKFYDWATDPSMKAKFACPSSLIDAEVSFWTHLRQDRDELRRMITVMKENNARHFCSMCMVVGLSIMWATTYDIDRARGTKYHERLRRFFIHLQQEDLRYCLGVMDPKGDRSLAPAEQEDPDLHLRVVDRNAAGIVVRGAKMHTSNAP